ncbi:MAG: CinA family protein [Clostridiales bacterium]|nr:CinA family protein [Clostridiales bacterium]
MKLEQIVFEILKQKGYKVATAESCTGGLLASTLINVNGASEIIDMSFVTYSNEAKQELVYVKKETIEKYNVVSEQVAKEMALGAAKHARAQIGLSTTGLAGPGGGTKERPVGTVCFGISINGDVYTFTHIFKNISRQYIRKASVKFILKKFVEILEKNINKKISP